MTPEILTRLSPARLRRLAQDLSLADADPQAVAAALASPTRIATVLGRLEPAERDALAILLLGMGGRGHRIVLENRLSHLHPSERHGFKALASLEAKGLLVPEQPHSWATTLYDVVQEPARIATVRWLIDTSKPFVTPAAPERGTDPAAVVADLARLLGALDHGARMTQGGPMRKLDQRRLLGALDAGQAALLKPGAPGWAGYEGGLGRLLAVLVALDLVLVPTPGVWRAGPEAERWAGMHAAAQWKSVVQAWWDLGMQRLGPPFDGLVAICASGGWCDAERLLTGFARFAPDPDTALLGIAVLFIRWGLDLGVLLMGPLDGSRIAVRLRPEALAALAGRPVAVPDMDEPLVVQPDFTVVAPPRCPAQALWDLERWAERTRVEGVAQYRITRASVRRCSRAGGSVTDWLQRLQAAGRYGVPDNVRLNAQEWAEPPARAEMRAAVVLRFAGRPPAGWKPPEGARRLAEDVWSVDIDQAATVYGHLGDAGIPVDGDPTAWRRLAKTAADSREAAESLPSLPWPGPVAGDPNTRFDDELPAAAVPAEPPATPVPAEPRLPPPLGPAAHRREIRRFLERAERARRLVSVVTLAGQRCAIVPTLSGQRVRGRCVDCGGDVDVAIAEIHSVGSR